MRSFGGFDVLSTSARVSILFVTVFLKESVRAVVVVRVALPVVRPFFRVALPGARTRSPSSATPRKNTEQERCKKE